MTGDHDDRRGDALLLQVLQHLDAVEHRHLDVEQDRVVRNLRRFVDSLLTGARLVDAVALVLESHANRLADRGFVVNYQDAVRHRAASTLQS